MFKTDAAWAQIQGTRKSQQDHAVILSWPNGFRLMLLADGMGGHTSGDIASHSVITVFKESFIASNEVDMRKRMIEALDHANKSLYQEVKNNPDLSGMGTTLIAVTYDGESIQWLSVGDSPLWLIRDGELKRLNEDHSMATVLASRVEKGEITAQEAASSPLRSQLLEAVMGENIELLDAPEEVMPVLGGDWILLASDGVETLMNQQIIDIVKQANSTSSSELVVSLLTAIEHVAKPSQDNASIVALKVIQEVLPSQPVISEPVSGDQVEEPQTEY